MRRLRRKTISSLRRTKNVLHRGAENRSLVGRCDLSERKTGSLMAQLGSRAESNIGAKGKQLYSRVREPPVRPV